MARKPKEAESVEEYQDQGGMDILEFEENLADMEDPEDLPPGTYLAEIQDVQPTANQAGTGMYYQQTLVIPEDQFPPDYDVSNSPGGVKLTYRLVSVPKPGDRRAVARVKRWMQTIGLSLDTNRIDVNEWIGRQVKVTVGHGKSQSTGDTFLEIRNITRADA